VFKGTFRYRIDPKGRLPIPASFRRRIPDAGGEPPLVLTLLDECLVVYPRLEWLRLEEQLQRLPAFSKSVKALSRVLASHAIDCEPDRQGRILIPGALRKVVDLSTEAVVIGVLGRFEIWNPDRWERFLRDSERLLEDVTLEVPWPIPHRPQNPSGDGAA
jgi:MraZ protein